MRNLFNSFFLLLSVFSMGHEGLSKKVLENIELYKLNPDFIVTNKAEFLKAIEKSNSHDIIYIKGNVSIDLSTERNIQIKGGVKLIGDRDIEHEISGAVLFTDIAGVHPFFNIQGDNVLIYGITVKGNDGSIFAKEDVFKRETPEYIKNNYLDLYYKNMYATPVSSGIATRKNNLVIANCELCQWTYTAVYVQKGAQNIQILSCYIHHNQRFGLGYGVTVDQGEAIIKNNLFDFNTHSIASTGKKGSRYIVEDNIFCENGKENSWAVDMHGGKDRKDGTNLAGDFFIICNNIFYLTNKRKAVVIRGVSRLKSVIENNIIYKDNKSLIEDSKVIEQINSKGNLEVKNNQIILI